MEKELEMQNNDVEIEKKKTQIKLLLKITKKQSDFRKKMNQKKNVRNVRN